LLNTGLTGLRLRDTARETAAQTAESPVQVAFEYSDGLGLIIVKKVQAEPEEGGTGLRWITSGKNNI